MVSNKQDLSVDRQLRQQLIGDAGCSSGVYARIPTELRDRLHAEANRRKIGLNTLCLLAFTNILDMSASDPAKVRDLAKAVECFADLINSSQGVGGLHLNGDFAYWESLRRGGRFEEWLWPFDEALDLLAAMDVAKAEKEGGAS